VGLKTEGDGIPCVSVLRWWYTTRLPLDGRCRRRTSMVVCNDFWRVFGGAAWWVSDRSL